MKYSQENNIVFNFIIHKYIDKTWLVSCSKFSHPMFNCLRIDYVSRRDSDVAIIIKNAIRVQQLQSDRTNNIQILGLLFLLNYYKYIYSVKHDALHANDLLNTDSISTVVEVVEMIGEVLKLYLVLLLSASVGGGTITDGKDIVGHRQ